MNSANPPDNYRGLFPQEELENRNAPALDHTEFFGLKSTHLFLTFKINY
jgi:hypothetical protein